MSKVRYYSQPSSQVFDANATDSDTGPHGQLDYSITSGLNGGIDFAMNLQAGRVFVGAELDRETRDLYVLNLTVKDRALKENDRRYTTMELTIHITDENDNPPVFTREIYTSTIPENVPTGYSVTPVFTTDADIGINAQHTFTITGGDGVGKFSINSSSGAISALPGLDRETKDTYYLSITAQDGGTPPLTGLCAVRVFISDTNDNKPVFSPTLYLTSISEATSPGTDVIPVHASDVDVGVNAEIKFSIVGGDVKTQFQVNSAGMISTNKSLDREDIPFYTLVVQASDKGSPPLTETVSVNVTILDINDNKPVFSESIFTVTVVESLPIGSRFLNVTASDADIGDHALLTWSIMSGNTGDVMAIEPSTGRLYNVGSFDRETTPEYFLMVKAKDAGKPPKASSTNVRVRISDSNDNSPGFNNADYTFYTTENEPIGTSVGKVQASDIDNGTHAQLVYSIMSGQNSGHFSINPVQGTIYTTVVLDRETVKEYRIKVKVSDSAAFPYDLSNITNVYITVLDQNDNNPSFSRPFYNASVLENSLSGTSVVTVTADDADSDANAELTYSITHNSSVEYFSIDSTTGEVSVKNAFDYEAVKVINVTITAQDKGIVRLSGSVSLAIYIEDVNDNSPIAVKEFYEASIRHDRALDSVPIITVSATDVDTGDAGIVQYQLQKSSSFFAVGNSDGGIRLTSSPESGQKYVLSVRANDKGSPPLTSSAITIAKLLGADVQIADVSVVTVEARRKKRETKNRIKVTIYAVKTPSGNSTDLNDKLSQAKEYLTRDDILKVLLDEDGNLSPNITNDKELEVFKIRSVKATKPTVPPPTPFFKQPLESLL
ncbi:hypothetical protein OS493_016595 [Desmophyllum pertusum]|uniref:Cadherin domain-containing protein n=1 Tax=Desmophyllum pertusum TaxID=174260 RepID=A0A9X0CXN7_9CNID|nr:hypothetical protein OS493_016595 [Desmophyllum pertusum]